MRSRLTTRLVASLALLLPAVACAHGDGTFEGPEEIRLTSRSAVSVAAGDFDGDGRLSLATANGTFRITILNRDPENPAAWVEQFVQPVGIGSFYVRAVDVDADGNDDLLVADPSSSAYVLRAIGDGSFEEPRTLKEAAGPRATAVGDWNGDGFLDLVTVNHPAASVSVFLGGGDGEFFHHKDITAGTHHHNHDIIELDYDGDGFLDLMVAVDFAGLLPLKGKGDGEFLLQSMVTNVGGTAIYVGAADFDSDGLDDVVLQTAWGGRDPIRTAVSAGDGSFKLPQAFGEFSCLPARVDLDRDGHLDLAAPASQGAMVVALGEGDGTFLPPLSFAMPPSSPTQVISADLDGDGNPDLISADGSSASIYVVRGKAGGSLLATGYSLGGFESAKGMGVSDLNGDGHPDILVSSARGGVHVFLEPASISPAEPSLWILTSEVYHSLEVVDLDDDGTPDLAGTNPLAGGGSIVVAFLKPSGEVREEKTFSVGVVPSRIVACRIDGDGGVDLLTPCTGSNEIGLVLNAGGGSFSQPRSLPTIEKPKDAAAGDFDGDGVPDVAVMADSTLAVHFGMGGGDLTGPVVIHKDPAKKFGRIAAADMDADGLADVVAADLRSQGPHLFLGRADRSFEARGGPGVDGPATSLEVADLDGNGLPDIAVFSRQRVHVALARRPEGFSEPVAYGTGDAIDHRLADINLDGALDQVVAGTSSVAVLLGGVAGDGRFRRGDADENGRVNLTDAIVILTRLFLGGAPLDCDDAADANDDGKLDITDAIALLDGLFRGGGSPPAPGPRRCGPDPTPDSFAACFQDCQE